MQLAPLCNHAPTPPWKRSLDDRSSCNVDHGVVFAIVGVEVGRIVVVGKHANDDSVETAEFRHYWAGLAVKRLPGLRVDLF